MNYIILTIQTIWAGVSVGDKLKLGTAYLGTMISLATTIEVLQVFTALAAIAASISVVYKNLKKDK